MKEKQGERFAIAFDFLKKAETDRPADGKLKLDGDKVFAVVQTYNTKPDKNNPRYELHKRYIDIQFILDGEELCGWAPERNFKSETEYDEIKDVCFGRVSSNESLLVPFYAGQIMIFNPWDAHAPCLAIASPAMVKKIVIKVAF